MKKTKFQSFLNNKAIKFVARMNLSWRVIGFAISSLILIACTTDADDSFDAATVCPSEGTNIYGMPNRGTFVDERDGQEYQYTTIGDQVWMAQSLSYEAAGSFCYDSLPENCEKYGRLYLGKNLDQLCPAGWRMPKSNDYDNLLITVDNRMNVLSAGYWENIQDTINTNKCGMSLRAGGFAYLTESRNESNDVSFWTNESDGSDYFYTLYVCYNYMSVSSLGHSIETMKYYIRCIKE